MKIIILNSLLLVSCVCFGQLPKINSNTTIEQKTKSAIVQAFQKQYDFGIAYIEESYWWSNKVHYQLLVMQNKKWYWASYSSKKTKKGNYTKPKIRITKVETGLGQALLQQFDQLSLWTMDSDSLNIKTRIEDDSTATTFSMADGINYRFEFFTQEDYRVVEAYEPDYYVEKLLAVKPRQKFIQARDLFKTTLKKIGT